MAVQSDLYADRSGRSMCFGICRIVLYRRSICISTGRFRRTKLCVGHRQEIDRTRGRPVGGFPREAISFSQHTAQFRLTAQIDSQDGSSKSNITKSPL